jgi:hypothetical protein
MLLAGVVPDVVISEIEAMIGGMQARTAAATR